MQHIEHCRPCRGKGYEEEPRNPWGDTASPVRCIYCGGTGRQSVMIGGVAITADTQEREVMK